MPEQNDAIPTLHAGSIGELVTIVRELVRETNLKWWFRGQADVTWDLVPAARRGMTTDRERNFANDFMARARLRHPSHPADDDFAGWVALMQHYGLPTRLLDWSWSPLVAAYFACNGHHPHQVRAGSRPALKNAAVWAIAPGHINELNGLEPFLYPLNAHTLREMLRTAIKGHDVEDRIAAATAVETDMRMFVQQGAFTVHTGAKRLLGIPGISEAVRRVIVPAEAVPHLAEELRFAGFRVGDLFPDLGNLALDVQATS